MGVNPSQAKTVRGLMEDVRFLKNNCQKVLLCREKFVPLHKMQKGQKRLKIAAWPWRIFLLAHEEVPHGVAAKTWVKE